MTSLTLQHGPARATLTRWRGTVILVVYGTPHVSSAAFMRQLARRPHVRAPQETETERRTVRGIEDAHAVLSRQGLRLNRAQERDLHAFFEVKCGGQ
ncbi:hypothetical protein [Deinococcus soli (ex Cha et al. 2016)]|uniref:hypothetical protein n=1 Tax=Deinococcus soli (ex Cha et al. 2016) TaxID=1309411 RepID=UPI001668DAF0|nr:hypothetical protein [Deinococcus soli (ex Cha et al. 2016)]GGB79398.1 hypothetical protein GCM10008019_39530 [Deinococcus soli (ex Cha et al. 2016)]